MHKRYRYHTDRVSKNTFRLKIAKFETRDIIQIVLLFAILMLWLFIRNGKNNTDTTEISKHHTMKQLLEIAIQPLGNTMYIWGGGWDVGDEKSGAGSTRIGVSPAWSEFAQKQDATYNYEDYRYKRELGLDCSGYIGWVVYNLFETEAGKEGYVTFSTEMAENFANRGWGKLYKNPKEFLTGDIVSMDGHVWICLGTCADGSVLLIHSSPPGVSICGTGIPEIETKDSEENSYDEKMSVAAQLAEEFMETYYEKWQNTYPNRMVSETYLKNVTVMRWNKQTLTDADVYQAMSGEEVLQILGE